MIALIIPGSKHGCQTTKAPRRPCATLVGDDLPDSDLPAHRHAHRRCRGEAEPIPASNPGDAVYRALPGRPRFPVPPWLDQCGGVPVLESAMTSRDEPSADPARPSISTMHN